jgi:hypothetical protein
LIDVRYDLAYDMYDSKVFMTSNDCINNEILFSQPDSKYKDYREMHMKIDSETHGTNFKSMFKGSILGCKITYHLLHETMDKSVHFYAHKDDKFTVFKIDEKSGILHTNTEGVIAGTYKFRVQAKSGNSS